MAVATMRITMPLATVVNRQNRHQARREPPRQLQRVVLHPIPPRAAAAAAAGAVGKMGTMGQGKEDEGGSATMPAQAIQATASRIRSPCTRRSTQTTLACFAKTYQMSLLNATSLRRRRAQRGRCRQQASVLLCATACTTRSAALLGSNPRTELLWPPACLPGLKGARARVCVRACVRVCVYVGGALRKLTR